MAKNSINIGGKMNGNAVAGDGNKQHYNMPGKYNWFKKILGYIMDHVTGFFVLGLLATITGVTTCKSCNHKSTREQAQKDSTLSVNVPLK